MSDRMELLEAALDSLPDGLALMGADGNLTFWSRMAEAIRVNPGENRVMSTSGRQSCSPS